MQLFPPSTLHHVAQASLVARSRREKTSLVAKPCQYTPSATPTSLPGPCYWEKKERKTFFFKALLRALKGGCACSARSRGPRTFSGRPSVGPRRPFGGQLVAYGRFSSNIKYYLLSHQPESGRGGLQVILFKAQNAAKAPKEVSGMSLEPTSQYKSSIDDR